MLCSVMAIMKSYPALGDTALPLSLLALWIHIFPCKPILVMGIAFRLIKYHFIENKQGMCDRCLSVLA